MTLLGWMHRKLMQNSTEPPKNPTTKNPSLLSVQTLSEHERTYHTDPPRRFSHSNNNKTTQKLPNILFESSQVVDEPLEPFDFLSIGTFGLEILNSTDDPPTPTLRQLTDQQIEISENELNLINYELGKFLESEDDHTDANAYNGTSERSSQESVITLSYKLGNEEDHESHEMVENFPLKNYLFAASVELAETETEVKRERTSLGELFKRNIINVVHDDDGDISSVTVRKSCEVEAEEVKTRKAASFIKKLTKKKFQSSSDHNDSYSTKKKLYKTLVKMFQKKVYPEDQMTEIIKLPKGNKKNSGKNNLDQSVSKKSKKMKLSWAGICRGASPVNGGHWIKTDSDYLVLEL